MRPRGPRKGAYVRPDQLADQLADRADRVADQLADRADYRADLEAVHIANPRADHVTKPIADHCSAHRSAHHRSAYYGAGHVGTDAVSDAAPYQTPHPTPHPTPYLRRGARGHRGVAVLPGESKRKLRHQWCRLIRHQRAVLHPGRG